MNYKKFLPFLLVFVPLVGIYAWWGGFSPVTIGMAVLSAFVYACLEHTGDYARLPDRLGEACRDLKAQGIAAGSALTVLYSNPSVVPLTQRKARGIIMPTVEIYRDSGSVITPGVLTVEMEAL